jgi:hypothetical protein
MDRPEGIASATKKDPPRSFDFHDTEFHFQPRRMTLHVQLTLNNTVICSNYAIQDSWNSRRTAGIGAS